MKMRLGIVLLLLMASTLSAADTNPPTLSAKYWASTNGVTAALSVKKYDDSYMIHTNGTSTGVLTKNVDQAAVTAFKNSQNKRVGVLMYLTPEGNLIPVDPTMQWGTEDNPIKIIYTTELHASSNSVYIGNQKLSQSSVESTKAKARYYPRGNLAGWDLETDDFVKNDAFNTITVTNAVPTNAVMVAVHIAAKCTVPSEFRIRQTGDTGTPNTKRFPILVANQFYYPDFLVDIDASRNMDLRFDTDGTWTIKFAIVGYWATD